MEIAIVGAGVVGIATAYELASDGHQVTVYEQRSAAAEEASFASSGLLSPSLLIPHAAAGVGAATNNLLLGSQPMFRLTRGARHAGMQWIMRWRKAARGPGAQATMLALEQLGRFSAARTRALAELFDVDVEASNGTLVLLRSPQDLRRTLPATDMLREAGTDIREVDSDTARLIEPGLSSDAPLSGALHAPEGVAANCRLFAQVMRYAAQARGARFVFNAPVKSISPKPAVLHFEGEMAPRRADAIVLCAGISSAALLRRQGVDLPIASIYGYTISAPVREDLHAPQGSIIDPLHRITISRQGQRVRVSGGAEIGWGGGEHNKDTLQKLYLALSGWFPGGVHIASSQVQIWRGGRPTLPDGAPVIGASGVPGLWLNTAHGACGWALACGSARLLADQINGQVSAVDPSAFGVTRF